MDFANYCGRTYAELDVLFERRVPARKFATTVVDPFATPDTITEEIVSKEKV